MLQQNSSIDTLLIPERRTDFSQREYINSVIYSKMDDAKKFCPRMQSLNYSDIRSVFKGIDYCDCEYYVNQMCCHSVARDVYYEIQEELSKVRKN